MEGPGAQLPNKNDQVEESEEIVLKKMIEEQNKRKEQLRQLMLSRFKKTQQQTDSETQLHPSSSVDNQSNNNNNIEQKTETTIESNNLSESSKSSLLLQDDDDEQEICRVCRSGPEPGRPLFYPCRCSGSIKYVHEDCLLTWLAHSKVTQCELCKTKYQFTPIYAKDTPSRLPARELVLGGLSRVGRWFNTFLRFTIVVLTWGVLVPIGTSWLWKFYFGTFSASKQSSGLRHILEFKSLANDCFFGFVVAATIVLSALTISSLLEYIQMYFAEHQLLNNNNINNDDNQNDGNQNDGNNNGTNSFMYITDALGVNLNGVLDLINAPLNANEDVELEDFVGLAGPYTKLAEKAIFVLGCFGAFLAVVVLIPKSVGSALLFIVQPYIEMPQSVLTVTAMLDNNQYIEEFAIRPRDFAAMIAGYTLLLSVGSVWLFLSWVIVQRQQRNNPIGQLLEFLFTSLKVVIIFSIEGGLFPLGAGYVMDYFTFNLFHHQHLDISTQVLEFDKDTVVGQIVQAFKTYTGNNQTLFNATIATTAIINATMENSTGVVQNFTDASLDGLAEFNMTQNGTLDINGTMPTEAMIVNGFMFQTISFFHKFPILSIIIHWVIGLMYMFFFASLVSWLRETLREGVLWFFRNPNDPNIDPIKEIIEQPVTRHVKRIFLSVLLYTFVLFVGLWAPIQTCVGLYPQYFPVDIGFKEIYEVPLDLLVFHIVIPFTIDHFRPQNILKGIIRIWFRTMGSLLSLNSYLFDDSNNQTQPPAPVVRPPNFKWRITALIALGFTSMYIFSFTLLLAPTLLGREISSRVFPFAISDLYSYGIGLYILWGAAIAVRFVYLSLRGNTLSLLLNKIIFALVIGLKWSYLLTMWLVVIPIFIGMFFELAIIIPLRCPINESPNLFLYHDWALGLLYLKIFFRILTLDGWNNTWKQRFDKVKNDGIAGVHATEITLNILLPILVPFVALLAAPYVFVKLVLPAITSNILIQSFIFRYIYLGMVSTYIGYRGYLLLISLVPQFVQMIYDDRYLVGQRLHNFSNSNNNANVEQREVQEAL